MNEKAANTALAEPPSRSFAAVLNSLRTAEDSFHFIVEDGGQSGTRLFIESAEMPVGWDSTGERLACDLASIVALRMVVRKDWTGVVVLPDRPGMVSINDAPAEDQQRLHNGDRVTLEPTAIARGSVPVTLVFHEPASLVALDSLLPQKLPPPVVPVAPPVEASSLTEASAYEPDAPVAALEPVTPQAVSPKKQRQSLGNIQKRYFGYFTLLELFIMIVGTVVGAIVVFLVLEYS